MSTGSPTWTRGWRPWPSTTRSGWPRSRPALSAAPDGLSAWQVALRVSWSRPWDQLGPFQHQAALGEVSAHLRHLERHGHARRTEVDGTALWHPLSG